MGIPIRIDEEIYDAAKMTAKAESRTIPGQIEYWAKIGKAALDNPDLPVGFIQEILVSKHQDRRMAEPFKAE